MKTLAQIDPITLEVQWQRLVTIVDEMDTATLRTSFSSIVGESHDFGCVLMDQDGAGLAQAQWSPSQFCTMMPITTRHMLRKFPKETLQAGDVLVTKRPLDRQHAPARLQSRVACLPSRPDRRVPRNGRPRV